MEASRATPAEMRLCDGPCTRCMYVAFVILATAAAILLPNLAG